jgi:hypothetical protein
MLGLGQRAAARTGVHSNTGACPRQLWLNTVGVTCYETRHKSVTKCKSHLLVGRVNGISLRLSVYAHVNAE